MGRTISLAKAQQVSLPQTLFIRIGLGLTLLLATGLRFYRLAGQSLWSDEGNSVALAQAGLGEIAARTAWDIHPPLYYWLLHSWIRIFGQSEVAVRSLSAVVGVLLVAVVYRLGARFFSKRVGLLAAVIASVSPFQVYYAQEARMYALLALLGALVVLATFELMRNAERVTKDAALGGPQLAGPYPARFTRYSLLYILVTTLGLYTHYAFAMILVATNLTALAWLWKVRGEGRTTRWWVGWSGLQLIPLILYLPWLPIAWRQLTTWPVLRSQKENVLATVWRTLTLGPAAENMSDLWLLGLGLLALIGTMRLIRQGVVPKAMLVLLYLGLPIGMTLALFKPAYLKFLLVASPALCLLLALALVGTQAGKGLSFWGWLGGSLVVVAAWGPLMAYYTDSTLARDDYRGLARYLEAVAGPEDAIILNAAGQQEVFGYYYHGDTLIYPLPRSRPLDPEATNSELELILARSRRIFSLYWATNESDPAGIIESWLAGHAFQATDVWVGNVRLVSYAAPLPARGLLPTEVRFGDQVSLVGYQLLASEDIAPNGEPGGASSSVGTLVTGTTPGDILQIQLRWMADAPLDVRYKVFLQALDEAHHLVGQRDAEPVVSTLDWRPGQPVLDRHGLPIELGTPPGEYLIIVGLYDAVSGQRLPTPDGDFVELERLAVERPVSPPPVAALGFHHSADAQLGPLRLVGYDRYKLGHSYDPDSPLDPGNPLHVVLYWQVQSRPQIDWWLALQLARVATPTSPVAEGVFPVAGIDYPATQWEPGEVVRAQFDLFLPGDAPRGDYRVSLHLIDETGTPGTEMFRLLPISVE
jgi:4-amino-4-deoxy-L-arabinose transferase-like glycosyltransferase